MIARCWPGSQPRSAACAGRVLDGRHPAVVVSASAVRGLVLVIEPDPFCTRADPAAISGRRRWGAASLARRRERGWPRARRCPAARGLRQLSSELTAGQPPAPRSSCDARCGPGSSRCGRVSGRCRRARRAAAGSSHDPGARRTLLLVAAAWQVSHRSGVGLGEALGRVARELAARAGDPRVVESELASARATARLLAALPVLALLVGGGAVPGSSPWAFLVGTPVGLACLGAGLGLGFAGLWWIEAIAAVERRADRDVVVAPWPESPVRWAGPPALGVAGRPGLPFPPPTLSGARAPSAPFWSVCAGLGARRSSRRADRVGAAWSPPGRLGGDRARRAAGLSARRRELVRRELPTSSDCWWAAARGSRPVEHWRSCAPPCPDRRRRSTTCAAPALGRRPGPCGRPDGRAGARPLGRTLAAPTCPEPPSPTAVEALADELAGSGPAAPEDRARPSASGRPFPSASACFPRSSCWASCRWWAACSTTLGMLTPGARASTGGRPAASSTAAAGGPRSAALRRRSSRGRTGPPPREEQIHDDHPDHARRDERGITTAEYAVGTAAGAGLAGLLYKLLTGGFGDQLLRTLFDHVLGLLGLG